MDKNAKDKIWVENQADEVDNKGPFRLRITHMATGSIRWFAVGVYEGPETNSESFRNGELIQVEKNEKESYDEALSNGLKRLNSTYEENKKDLV